MNPTLERRLVVGFSVAALVLLLITGAAAWNVARFDDTFRRVAHTHEVLAQLERLLIGVLSMQSGARGYVLTGADDLLRTFHEGDETAAAAAAELRLLTADNSLQQRRLDRLDLLLLRARQIMQERIAVRRASGLEAARGAFSLLSGQQVVDSIRWSVNELETEEKQLLNERVHNTQAAARETLQALAIGGFLAVAFIGASGVLVLRDLRHRLRAEHALQQSQRMFQRLFNDAPDAMIQVDRAGHIVRANRQTESLFGWRPDELAGQPLDALLPDRYRDRHRAHFRAYFAAPRTRVMGAGLELFGRRKDGSEFPVDIMLSPLETDDGLEALAVIRDITERRLNDEKIRQLNVDLQLQNARLEIANKELESFSYSVSHDLRAPLRHIDGFANLLAKHAASSLDDKARRFLSVISDSARRMGRLIDDLLTFSRMGRAQMEPALLDHDQLLAAVLREGGFDQKPGIAWQINPLPPVHADAAMLRQVWLNLIDNAVKYSSHAAAPQVEIGAAAEAPKGEQVFFVRDNGVGFDMKYAAKLFGVFQRLHSEAEFEGTGIGLANVRRIITRHGGRTWAESTPGDGATFYFSLPVASQPAS